MAGEYCEDRWFLSPTQHIVQWCIYMTIAFVAYRYAASMKRRPLPSHQLKSAPQPLSMFEYAVAAALTCTFALQVYYKVSRGFLFSFNLLFPCHVVSLLILSIVITYHTNYRLSCFLFNILSSNLEFPFLALLLPDTADHAEVAEHHANILMFAFWSHHIMLLVFPILLFLNARFPLDRRDYYFYLLSAAYALFFSYCLQLPLALVVKHNINYMIAPPKPRFFNALWYRDFCTIGLLWGLWVSGYAAPAVVVAAKRMVMGKESTLNMVVWRDEEERQKTK